jgi:hypothetical protein
MPNNDHEKLLWQLADIIEDSDQPPATDEVLATYRQGELSKEESRRLERHLACSRSARARLVELARAELDAPPPALREQVLRRASKARARWRWSRWSIPAAIAAVLLLSVSVLINRSGPTALPENLAYDVVATGLADARDAAAASASVNAYPQTEIRVTITPRDVAVANVEIALYQERGAWLQRAHPGSQVQLQEQRGVAIMTSRAADLVGSTPGTYHLWVVAAVAGDLPDRFQLAAGESARQVLRDGSRRRAYPLEITLVPLPEDPGDR